MPLLSEAELGEWLHTWSVRDGEDADDKDAPCEQIKREWEACE
jgi:hypothetical protein